MNVGVASRYVVRDLAVLGGEPFIINTKTPVRAVVELWRLGTAPEDIPLHLPYLNLAQVFDALSFYMDNQDEINGHIESNRVPEELIHPSIQQRHTLQ